MKTLVALAVLLSPSAVLAEAGSHLVYKGSDGKVTYYLNATGARMKVQRKGGDTTVIFNAERKTLYMVDHKRKQYMAITQGDLNNMAKMMDTSSVVNDRMKAAMKGKTPEQQAFMKKMMARFSGGKKAAAPAKKGPEVKYSKMRDGVKIGKWTTTQWRGSRSGKKVADVWTTTYRSAGLERSSFAGIRKLAAFMNRFVGSMPGGKAMAAKSALATFNQWSKGLPVKFSWEGKVVTLLKAKSANFKPGIFQPPKGFRMRRMPNMKRRG